MTRGADPNQLVRVVEAVGFEERGPMRPGKATLRLACGHAVRITMAWDRWVRIANGQETQVCCGPCHHRAVRGVVRAGGSAA